MKNYTSSDYACNKFNDGIVYRYADGTEKIIKLSDYLSKNPHKTENDFNALKSFSNENYFEQDRAENAQTKKNIPLDEFLESEVTALSPEDYFIGAIDEQERQTEYSRKKELAFTALKKLTETQRRRYLLYKVNGLTYRKIGEIEGKDIRAIFESIKSAENKIKKNLKNL